MSDWIRSADGKETIREDSDIVIRRMAAEIERLTSLLAGVEIALARDNDIDGAMRLIVADRTHQQSMTEPK